MSEGLLIQHHSDIVFSAIFNATLPLAASWQHVTRDALYKFGSSRTRGGKVVDGALSAETMLQVCRYNVTNLVVWSDQVIVSLRLMVVMHPKILRANDTSS